MYKTQEIKKILILEGAPRLWLYGSYTLHYKSNSKFHKRFLQIISFKD